MSAPGLSRSQQWLDLQGAHDAIAEEVLEHSTPTPAAPSLWIHFRGDARFHAVLSESTGGYWLYCSRFATIDSVVEACASAAMKSSMQHCSCCESRVRNPYLVPAKLQKPLSVKVAAGDSKPSVREYVDKSHHSKRKR